MSVDEEAAAVWNGTICHGAHPATEVNSTLEPAVDPAGGGGIACADTAFFLAIYGPLYGLVCVLGLVGNCLSICVLSWGRSRRQAVSTYLLKALAVCDNVFLATAAAVQMYPAMMTVAGQHGHLQRIYPYYQTLQVVCRLPVLEQAGSGTCGSSVPEPAICNYYYCAPHTM